MRYSLWQKSNIHLCVGLLEHSVGYKLLACLRSVNVKGIPEVYREIDMEKAVPIVGFSISRVYSAAQLIRPL